MSVISFESGDDFFCVTARDRQDSRCNGIICLNFTISSYAPNDAKKAEDRNRCEVLGARVDIYMPPEKRLRWLLAIS
jgi:hypothetical protein